MKKYKNKKKKSVNFDNKKQLNVLINHVYGAIMKLDTYTLHAFSFEIYRELISRDDFNDLDDEIRKFQILYDDLVQKGVDISCLIL